MRATDVAREWENYAHQLEAQMQSLHNQMATAQGRKKVDVTLQHEAADLRTELQALGTRHLHMMEHFQEALDGVEAQFAQEREQHACDLEDVKEDRDPPAADIAAMAALCQEPGAVGLDDAGNLVERGDNELLHILARDIT